VGVAAFFGGEAAAFAGFPEPVEVLGDI